MSHFLTLLRHELRALFIAPATYVAAVLFLLLMGYLYVANLGEYALRAQDLLPAERYFLWFFLTGFFLVPLLTMRSLAEERRTGTLGTLMTTAVSAGEIVLAKFLATYLYFLLFWLLTLAFPLLSVLVLEDTATADILLAPAPLMGSYAYIALSGCFFVAVGVFSSSLTRSQLVAAALTFCILFLVIFGSQLLSGVGGDGLLGSLLHYADLTQHYLDFSRGVLDSRPLFFYLTNTLLVLGLAILVVEGRA